MTETEHAVDPEASGRIKLPLGIHRELDIDDYHNSDGISKTGLCILDIAPKAYLEFVNGNQRPDTKALRIGKAFHAMLDGTFDTKYAVGPEVKSRSEKAWKDFEAKHAQDLPKGIGSSNCSGDCERHTGVARLSGNDSRTHDA